jgi:hypothetical protein
MKVNVMTDHHSLVHLLKQRNLSRSQACWTEVIADFNLHFNYIPGKDNSVADALSRKLPGDKEPQPEDVACVAALAELGTTLSMALTAQIKEGYMSDPFCQSLRGVLPLPKDSPGEISWHPSTGAIAQLITLLWFEVCLQVVTCKLHVQLEFSLNSWVIS